MLLLRNSGQTTQSDGLPHVPLTDYFFRDANACTGAGKSNRSFGSDTL